MFAKPLVSNVPCIFSYLAIVAQQRAYILHYNASFAVMVRMAKLMLRVVFHSIKYEDIILYNKQIVFIVISILFKLRKGCGS
jgi:hypothetical protein